MIKEKEDSTTSRIKLVTPPAVKGTSGSNISLMRSKSLSYRKSMNLSPSPSVQNASQPTPFPTPSTLQPSPTHHSVTCFNILNPSSSFSFTSSVISNTSHHANHRSSNKDHDPPSTIFQSSIHKDFSKPEPIHPTESLNTTTNSSNLTAFTPSSSLSPTQLSNPHGFCNSLNSNVRSCASVVKSDPNCMFCEKYRGTIEQDILDKHLSERKIRKMLDVDITNQSLLAINASLESALISKELELKLLKRDLTTSCQSKQESNLTELTTSLAKLKNDETQETYQDSAAHENRSTIVVEPNKPIDRLNQTILQDEDCLFEKNVPDECEDIDRSCSIEFKNLQLLDPEIMFEKICLRINWLIENGQNALSR